MKKENDEYGIRKPGRPTGSGKYTYHGKCDVRLSKEDDSILSALAERNGVTRSDIMRRALKDFWKFNGGRD